MTGPEIDARSDTIEEILDMVDAGFDLESITNHCENELARLAGVRREITQEPIRVKRAPKISFGRK